MDQTFIAKDLLNISKRMGDSVQNEIMKIIHGLEIRITDGDRDILSRLRKVNQYLSVLQEKTNTYTIETVKDDLQDKKNNAVLLDIETMFFKIEQDFNLETQVAESSMNSELLEESLINHLMVEVRNSKKILKTFKALLKSLQSEAETLRNAVEQEKMAIQMLQEQLNQIPLSKTNSDDILKQKHKKLKLHLNIRIYKLGEFLSKYFPPAGEYDLASVIKDRSAQRGFKSMTEIVECLLQKFLETPHDPWVMVDETFWISYLNTLKLARVIISDSKNKNLIALDL